MDQSRIPVWFADATRGLLDEGTELGELKRCADQLYAGLVASSRHVESEDLSDDPSHNFESGRAISPSAAAMCVKDFRRTAAFLRGIALALRETRERVSGPIEVVYAGTGPFATLLLPFLARYARAGVRFTMIDAHLESCVNVARLISELGLDAAEHHQVCADATRYVHRRPIHVAIVETMQRALLHEPQVAVTRNLAAQLHEDGVLIPETITIDLAHTDRDRTFDVLPANDRRTVLELSRSICVEVPAVLRSGLTVALEPGPRPLALFTSIRTYGPHCIGWNESGLTMPLVLFAPELRAAAALHVRYVMGGDPGFSVEPAGAESGGSAAS